MASPFSQAARPKGMLLPAPNAFAVASLVLVFFGVGTLASYLPGGAPLRVTLPLVELAVIAFAVGVWRLFATRTYAWSTFLAVARPAFLAAATASVIIEFAFLYDNVAGWSLVILSTGLALIALDLPLLLAYSVARNEPIPEPEPEPYVPFGHGS